jgi:flagellar biosynthesis/type III secretory pathway protein FliH
MPGPGKGKRAQKKKWRDNASQSVAIYSITTTTATGTTSPEEPAANDANDAMCIDIAAAASSDDAIMQPQPFIYTDEEVQVLLDEARLEGWEEGIEEGLKIGMEKTLENGKKMFEKGQRIGHRLGKKEGLDEGERLAGHGEGLCISKEAHIRELWRGAVDRTTSHIEL